MKLTFICIPLLTLAMVGCTDQSISSETTPQSQTEQPVPIGDTSRTSLDWNGTYSGVTPCASCEGINTVLTLNLDNTYVLETSYLGEEQPGQKPKVFAEAGAFKWEQAGNKISLMGDASSPSPQQFQVGENQLFMLDKEGQRITGSLAQDYRLVKQVN